MNLVMSDGYRCTKPNCPDCYQIMRFYYALLQRKQQLEEQQTMQERYFVVEYTEYTKPGSPTALDKDGASRPLLYATLEDATARMNIYNQANAKYNARVVVVDLVGTPLLHSGKMVGLVAL